MPSPVMGGLCRAARMRSTDLADGSDCCALTETLPPTCTVRNMSSVRTAFRVTCDNPALIVFGASELHPTPFTLDVSGRVLAVGRGADPCEPGYTFVPGHGDVGNAQDVAAFRECLATLRTMISDAQAQGRIPQAAADGEADKQNRRFGEDRASLVAQCLARPSRPYLPFPAALSLTGSPAVHGRPQFEIEALAPRRRV
jgi:hypothetical protein